MNRVSWQYLSNGQARCGEISHKHCKYDMFRGPFFPGTVY